MNLQVMMKDVAMVVAMDVAILVAGVGFVALLALNRSGLVKSVAAEVVVFGDDPQEHECSR